MEQNYEFRKRLRQVHRPNRINPDLRPDADECAIDPNWAIVLPDDSASDKVVRTAALDLQDYLQISMGVYIPMRRESCGIREIRFELDAKTSSRTDAFLLQVGPGSIKITGKTGKGVFAGCIYIEDMMNLREAPFLTHGKVFCEPLIEARGVHSGFGLDDFPDHHLNAIAHAGFNEIYLFVREIGKCANSYCDIQDLIDRAELYGLDVMFYSYIPGYKHPDDQDAEEYFEKAFGSIFKHYPKAKGIMLVGETAEFPSSDPATTGKRWHESLWHGIPDSRPSPGWWPCRDYPLWINTVKKAIQKHKPDAKIAFSTYNWLWAPAEERRNFLETFPKDIQLLVPFEMFKSHRLDNGAYRQVMDYTISETDFSECCREEMEMAHQLGLRIGVTSMTCGTPWNFGTAPYIPAPMQWMKKFRTLLEAKKKHGADNFYDSHHMGWWPSIVTDLGRAAFRQPETDLEVMLRKLTVRDCGDKAADDIMDVWRLWSEAMTFFVASNENQYGPFRVGPSYPLVFHANVTRTMASKEIKFPTMKNAYAGSDWLKTFFQPFENANQSPYSFRRKPEMASQMKMLELWHAGVNKLTAVESLIPEKKRDLYHELLYLGIFIECFMITGINVNKWYQLNLQLLNSEDPSQSLRLLDEIENLAESEIANAQNAIPCVEADSRLGWEPSMEYMTDLWHLEWKIRQVRTMIDGDIASYRKMINLGNN
jgi:hypothetical protein